jgi:hypothetical protein
MSDPREDIMVRILALLNQLSGTELVARNLDEIPDTKLPAAILYDGDEAALDNPRATSGKPSVIHATPIIVIDLGDVPENVGTLANQWLTAIKSLILLDDTLQSLCGDFQTAGAHYGGAETSLHPGRTTHVVLTINFIIGYHLKAWEL